MNREEKPVAFHLEVTSMSLFRMELEEITLWLIPGILSLKLKRRTEEKESQPSSEG